MAAAAALAGLLWIMVTMRMAEWEAVAGVVVVEQRAALLLLLSVAVALYPVVMTARGALGIGVPPSVFLPAAAAVAGRGVVFFLPSV